jgi:hypothetical protein
VGVEEAWWTESSWHARPAAGLDGNVSPVFGCPPQRWLAPEGPGSAPPSHSHPRGTPFSGAQIPFNLLAQRAQPGLRGPGDWVRWVRALPGGTDGRQGGAHLPPPPPEVIAPFILKVPLPRSSRPWVAPLGPQVPAQAEDERAEHLLALGALDQLSPDPGPRWANTCPVGAGRASALSRGPWVTPLPIELVPPGS